MRGKRNGRTPGVEKRHLKACASHQGKRCSCDPSYRAVVFDSVTGRKATKTFATEKEALTWREAMYGELRAGRLRAADPVTVRQVCERWLEDAEAGVVRNRSGDVYKPSAVRSYRD